MALRQPPGTGAAVPLVAGFQVCDQAREAILESVNDLTVSRAWLELDPAEGTSRGRILLEDGDRLADVTADNGAGGQHMLPFGEHPRPGHALRLGFLELPAGPGDQLSLYVWTAGWDSDAELAGALRAEAERIAARCGRPADDGWLRHYWARTVWEYWAGAAGWHPMQTLADETRALTLSGRVVLQGPAEQPPDPTDGRYWIRCRLESGGYECPPLLDAVAVNATPVRHAVTMRRPEHLGRSHGTAAQSFELARRPVVAGSTRLRITVGGAVEDQWHEVADWDRSGFGDRHYRLDPEQATICFGDGRRGRVPPAGAQIEAREYQAGGGADGNVPAGRLARLAGAGALLQVVQPFPATGGAPAELLSRAHGRALDLLAQPARGVTAGDLEALARETPGVPVGRAHAIPGYHPAFGCLDVAGVVTVIVLPSCGDPPAPSRQFLNAVRRYLEPRRPLATELIVVGPSYVPVTITATLHVTSGAPSDAAQQADGDLAAFFHPLHGGSGDGWPFGRGVLETEIMARLNALPGVRFVDGLGISGPGDQPPRCGNLPLCPTELVWSRPHQIIIERTW